MSVEVAPEDLFGRVQDYHWREKAACYGSGVEFILPGYAGARATDALAICETCPVQKDCLTESLLLNEMEGIWGGKRPAERRSMRDKIVSRYKDKQAKSA